MAMAANGLKKRELNACVFMPLRFSKDATTPNSLKEQDRLGRARFPVRNALRKGTPLGTHHR
jgi:hypothetical protein